LEPCTISQSLAKAFANQYYTAGSHMGTCKARGGTCMPHLNEHGEVNLDKIRSFYSYSKRDYLFAASGSGSGSDLGPATEASLAFLAEVITRFNVTRMLDAPCGEVNWLFHAWETDSLKLYVGVDIVPDTIRMNRLRFQHHTNKYFYLWDFVTCPIPRMADQGEQHMTFDLVHMRHVIQHLPPDKGVQVMRHVARSGAKYLMSTTYICGQRPCASANKAISDGGMRYNSLAKPPYNFPKPLMCRQTGGGRGDHRDHTCLYLVKDLPL